MLPIFNQERLEASLLNRNRAFLIRTHNLENVVDVFLYFGDDRGSDSWKEAVREKVGTECDLRVADVMLGDGNVVFANCIYLNPARAVKWFGEELDGSKISF